MSEIDSLAIRTAAKTFSNASHGERGSKTVLQLVVNSVGRHPILRALIKTRLKACYLEWFVAFVKDLVDKCLEGAGYPDLGLDCSVKILGEVHTVNSRAITNKMIQSVVDGNVKEANLQDIPGNTLRLLWLAQESLSDRQFRKVILDELERRHLFRYNRHFWDLLESEYTREGALEMIKAGFEAEGRCFQTGVYRIACRCGMCGSDRG